MSVLYEVGVLYTTGDSTVGAVSKIKNSSAFSFFDGEHHSLTLLSSILDGEASAKISRVWIAVPYSEVHPSVFDTSSSKAF